MCDICHMYPCHPQCPNAPEPPTVFICSGCGECIYDGDEYCGIFGEQYCLRCVDDMARFADEEMVCYECEDTIQEGDTYYEVMGRVVCEDCMHDAKGVARYDTY